MGRLEIAQAPDGFEAVIPAVRDAKAVRVGGVVVVALVVGLAIDSYLIYRALSSIVTAASVVPFVLLFFVSLYWTPIVYTWLWNLSGREIVRAYDGRLRIERVVLRNLRFVFDFDMLDIENIRARPEPDDASNLTLRHQQARYGLGGNVAFEAEGRPYRVGIALPEHEAEELAEEMRRALLRDSALALD